MRKQSRKIGLKSVGRPNHASMNISIDLLWLNQWFLMDAIQSLIETNKPNKKPSGILLTYLSNFIKITHSARSHLDKNSMSTFLHDGIQFFANDLAELLNRIRKKRMLLRIRIIEGEKKLIKEHNLALKKIIIKHKVFIDSFSIHSSQYLFENLKIGSDVFLPGEETPKIRAIRILCDCTRTKIPRKNGLPTDPGVAQFNSMSEKRDFKKRALINFFENEYTAKSIRVAISKLKELPEYF